MTPRTGQLEQDSLSGTARMGRAGQNRQNKTARTGPQEKTARTRLPGQDLTSTGLLGLDSQGITEWRGQKEKGSLTLTISKNLVKFFTAELTNLKYTEINSPNFYMGC